MKIKDLNNLLAEAEEQLKVDAVEDKEPETAKADVDTNDVYPSDEHKETEEVEEVIVENEIAENPEIETEPEEVTENDVYPSDEHKETEEVEEVIVEDTVVEDTLEVDPEAVVADEKFDDGVAEPIEATSEISDEINDVLTTDPVETNDDQSYEEIQESISKIFDFLKGLNEELAENPEIETEPEEVTENDVYPSDEHKETEEVEEVIVEEKEPTDKELAKIENSKEQKEIMDEVKEDAKLSPDKYADKTIKDVKKLKEESTGNINEARSSIKNGKATEEEQLAHDLGHVAGRNIQDAKKFKGEDHGENIRAAHENIKLGKQLKKELKEEADNEATVDKAPETMDQNIDTEDVYPSDQHEETYEVEEVIVESAEEDNVINGDNVKTVNESEEVVVDREAETDNVSVDTNDVYPNDEHKNVEDVVEVVVEAARLCKENNEIASLANITKYAKTLFESESVAMDFEEKEYDVDASIESSEMNGNDEKFEDYEDIQGDEAEAALSAVVPAEAMHETVNYTSLKEACMLDEDYFVTNTYSIQTSEEKIQKLTEQISLLCARESMDPMYDELLKTAVYAQRLQEALVNKYNTLAESKVEMMISNAKKINEE